MEDYDATEADEATDDLSRNQRRLQRSSLIARVRDGRDYGPETVHEYGPQLWEVCFELWMTTGSRNAERTARLLKAEVGDDLPSTPVARQIRRRAKEDEWDIKADDAIKMFAPNLNERDAIEFWNESRNALRIYSQILHNDYPEKVTDRRLESIRLAALDYLKARGFVPIGNVPVQIGPPPAQFIPEPDATPQQLARDLMEHIAQSKSERERHR